MLNFLKNIGPTEILIIVLILIVLFGAKFAKRLARTGGESYKEIKKVKRNMTQALEDSDEPQKHKKEVSA